MCCSVCMIIDTAVRFRTFCRSPERLVTADELAKKGTHRNQPVNNVSYVEQWNIINTVNQEAKNNQKKHSRMTTTSCLENSKLFL